MLALLTLTALAGAAPPDTHVEAARRPLTVEASMAASAGPPAIGGGFAAGARFQATRRMGVEVRLAEAMVAPELRVLTTIRLGGTWQGSRGPMVRFGLAHLHELSKDLLLDKPIGAVLGSASGIVHRSGVTVGLAMNGRLSPKLTDRLGWTMGLDVDAYPDKGGPPVYATVSGGITLGLGKAK